MALHANPGVARSALTETPRDLTVARAAAGDAEAFRALYQGHVGRVHAVCLRLVADARTAEELTQDVFVQAWRGLASFRGDSSFGTWLHRLTVNVTMMHLRAARRRDRRLPLWADPPEIPVPGDHDPGRTMDLEQAIASLPEGCRTVFVLHDVEGWRHEEIAERLQLAVGTCKAHLFRARRLLRERLA
ncbi:MAG TPA: RNA polymerase sigma factor [Gemmatimonadales bacterium]